MREGANSGVCPLCRGTKRPGTTTFTADLGFGVVVIRNVPASVCSQCGSDWIEDKVTQQIELIVAEAKAKRSLVEVTALS
jgi:YgiT-type zinc finger domain-containing protein